MAGHIRKVIKLCGAVDQYSLRISYRALYINSDSTVSSNCFLFQDTPRNYCRDTLGCNYFNSIVGFVNFFWLQAVALFQDGADVLYDFCYINHQACLTRSDQSFFISFTF